MELSAQHGRIDRGRGIDIAGLGNAVRPRHLRLSCKILRGHAAAIGIHAPARVTPGAAGDGRYGVSGVEAPAGTCLFRRVLPCSRLSFGSYPAGDPEPGAVLRSAIAPCRSVVIEAEKGNLGSGTLGKTHIGGCYWPGDVALCCDHLFGGDIARAACTCFPSLDRAPGGHAGTPIVSCGRACMGGIPATVSWPSRDCKRSGIEELTHRRGCCCPWFYCWCWSDKATISPFPVHSVRATTLAASQNTLSIPDFDFPYPAPK